MYRFYRFPTSDLETCNRTWVLYRSRPLSGARARSGLIAAALVGVIVVVALPASPAAASSSSDEGTLVSLTNGERSSRGIRRLSSRSDLNAIAERHSRDMASHRRIYHDSNLPYEVSGWRALGENVGRGSSARSVHRAFMSSSVHRAHILGTRYNQIGIGAVRGSDNYLYVTEVFAGRGSTSSSTVTRSTVSRHPVAHRATHRRSTRVRATSAIRTVPLIVPCRSVNMLLELLALDESTGPP